MKHFKFLGLLAAALAGTLSGFTNRPHHFNGTTYYGITDGAGCCKWVKSVPPGYVCVTGQCACTIVTKGGFTPVNCEIPTSSQATILTSGVYKPF